MCPIPNSYEDVDIDVGADKQLSAIDGLLKTNFEFL